MSHIPQFIWLALTMLGLFDALLRHGNPRRVSLWGFIFNRGDSESAHLGRLLLPLTHTHLHRGKLYP